MIYLIFFFLCLIADNVCGKYKMLYNIIVVSIYVFLCFGYMTGSDWNFVNSGEINLSSYVGKKIQFGFKYISTTTDAPTWEVKNILILDMPSK